MKTNKVIQPKYINADNSDGNKFIGIRGEKNTINVYLPECFSIDENKSSLDEQIDDVNSIIKCIKLSKVINADGDANNNNEKKGTSMPIVSYMWIIEDYKKNGLLVNREIIKTNSIKGKIDWKQTLQQPPIVSKGSIICANFISKYKTNTDHILIEIYKYCLKVALDRIGWLYKMNSNFIKILSVNESKNKYYINIVRNELSKTFDDLKRKRLEHLYLILLNVKDSKNISNFEYGTYSFYMVFEKMIDSLFNGLEDTNEFNPKGEWYLEDRGTFDSSSLRPDTVLLDENAIYIIDSKYYRYGATGDIKNGLPTTQSIQKQITYAKHAYENKKVDVYNAFLLPVDKKKNGGGDLRHIGYATSKWEKNGLMYEKIHTFFIDLRFVIRNYDKNDNNKIINFFKEEIHQHIFD